jgi:hypothetical protein
MVVPIFDSGLNEVTIRAEPLNKLLVRNPSFTYVHRDEGTVGYRKARELASTYGERNCLTIGRSRAKAESTACTAECTRPAATSLIYPQRRGQEGPFGPTPGPLSWSDWMTLDKRGWGLRGV